MLDRPRAHRHTYKGISLLIDIRYGDHDEPRIAVITAEDAPGIQAVAELGVNNYEDALAIGIEEAERWVDLRPA